MRVFVSSTVYDLLDVRAELSDQLRSLGIVAVLSDDKLSDFQLKHDADSIQTCLVNLESCDEVIVILDQRYGPRLGKSGFEDISATHLEYRRAVELGKPVHFFVRDRLVAEFSIWKRNGEKGDLKFAWAGNDNIGLFDILQERSKLVAGSSKSNWYSVFTTSVDLKAALAKYFGEKLLPERLVDAIQRNQFPLFDISAETVADQRFGVVSTLTFKATLTNVGGAPAFNASIYWDGRKGGAEKQVFAPGQSTLLSVICGIGSPDWSASADLIAEYDSAIGLTVRDHYEVGGQVGAGLVVGGGRLVDRSFRRSKPLMIEIEGD